MKHRLLWGLLLSICYTSPIAAQDTLATKVTYDLSSEIAVGTGDFTAYQLSSNRHHVLSTRPNTGYVRGAIEAEHPLSKYFTLAGGMDVIASVHADHKAYLQQLYADLRYDKFYFEIGTREHDAILRNTQLSSGTFAKGTNAKPIPQVRIGTTDFWTVPYTKGWLQIHFEGGYGKFLDSQYRKDVYFNHPDANRIYCTGAWYHQKHLYFRTNPEKRFYVTAGIEHVAQFGGNKYGMEHDQYVEKEHSVKIKDFFDIFLPCASRRPSTVVRRTSASALTSRAMRNESQSLSPNVLPLSSSSATTSFSFMIGTIPERTRWSRDFLTFCARWWSSKS